MVYQPVYLKGTTVYGNGNEQNFHSGSRMGKATLIQLDITRSHGSGATIHITSDYISIETKKGTTTVELE